jgi:dipeptidase D
LSVLKNLSEPLEFWEFFEKLTEIPRCSGNEEKVRVYIQNQAKDFGFETKIDKVGNLVVKIPSKLKTKLKIVLQCHMDMVCEKNESIKHDFSKDPLKLKVIEIDNEKWITAEGTTLGADNGVGIAFLLTLMKKIHDGGLKFDSIGFNLLFTVDEEVGLKGAFEIEKNLIEGEYLINLDSEEDEAFTVGCASGIVSIFEIKAEFLEKKFKEDGYIPVKIGVSGLSGGHSGAHIHLGRANSLKILSQILWKLNNKYLIHIHTIEGGNRNNAIPREALAILYVKEDELSDIDSFIKKIVPELKIAYEDIEPDIAILIEKMHNFNNFKVFSKDFQKKLLNILYILPNGPHFMHPKIKDLVFTSTNFAIIKTIKDKIEITTHQRSMSEYFKYIIWEKLKVLFDLSGINYTMKIDSDYPGWTPNFNSKLLDLCKEAYIEVFDKNVKIKAIHAGLECGVLKKHFPEMEMISFGPNNKGTHSPDERLQIKSVERIWMLLVNLLHKINL